MRLWKFSGWRWGIHGLIGAAVTASVGWVFYHRIFICLLFSFVGLRYANIRERQTKERYKRELALQFRQALLSLSSALGAGKSVENAFREAEKDMRLLYAGENIPIVKELIVINRKSSLGQPIERSLREFAERCQLPEVEQFTDVFSTCKRSGGDLIEVIRRTTFTLSDKIETEQEIYAMTAAKRFEANALCVIPFVIVALLSWSSPDYMASLYGGAGTIVMSVALGILVLSCWMMHKLMNIQV